MLFSIEYCYLSSLGVAGLFFNVCLNHFGSLIANSVAFSMGSNHFGSSWPIFLLGMYSDVFLLVVALWEEQDWLKRVFKPFGELGGQYSCLVCIAMCFLSFWLNACLNHFGSLVANILAWYVLRCVSYYFGSLGGAGLV